MIAKPIKRSVRFEVNKEFQEALGRPVYIEQYDFSAYEAEKRAFVQARQEGKELTTPVSPATALQNKILSMYPHGYKAGDWHIAYKGKAYRLRTGSDEKQGIVYAYIDQYKKLDWAPPEVQQALRNSDRTTH